MDDGGLDPDEADIEASRAPLLDHLTELRSRLLIAVAAILAATVVCFAFATPIYDFLVKPYEEAIVRVAAERHEPPPPVEMVYTHPMEFFLSKLKLALFGGLIAAFPIVAWQIYAFIAPGLYRRERKAAAPFLIGAPAMFAAGAAFAYYVALPFAMRFALGTELNTGTVHIKLLPKVNEYLSFVITLVLAFAACFQLPVALALLARAGLVGAAALRKGRRFAIVGIAAFSACFTPPDVISMTIMAAPVYLLYEISIWLVWAIERAHAKAEAAHLASA
ncbi:MAG: twin-arginine translocase subunit TatC [Hyphomonadaceae bacterium]